MTDGCEFEVVPRKALGDDFVHLRYTPAVPAAPVPSAASLFERLGARVQGLNTPALVIDRAAARHNIAAMVKRVGKVRRWRPHIKTIKQAPLVEALFEAGVTRLKCATALEAQLAIDCAVRTQTPLDLLVAYPLAGPNAEAIVELRRRTPEAIRISLLADDPEHLAELDGLCERFGVEAGVFIDVDLGMGRTGQTPDIWAEAAELDSLKAVTLHGLHGYDGHHRGEEDAAAFAGYDQLIELAAKLSNDRATALELVTSGTHSYAHALSHPGLSAGDAEGRFAHAVSPGTVVLSDRRSHPAVEDLGLHQAAFVLTRVVSAGPGRVTLDCGSKGLAPDTPPEAFSALEHPKLHGRRRSEEHLVCETSDGAALPSRGELLWVVPEHVCTTVNMYRQAVHLLDDGSLETVEIVAASRLPWGLTP